MRPTPRSLVLDLLSTLRRGAMPVRALVEAGELFDLESNAVRVALARLLADGLVERDERGLYRLGAPAGAIAREVAGWRDPGALLRRWDGTWFAALVNARAGSRKTRLAGERALRMLGFQTLAPGLEIRPDNLAGGFGAVRERLRRLGLDAAVPVLSVSELEPALAARAPGLWNAAELRRTARVARIALERSERRLPRLAPEAAMVESFLIGGRAIRRIALDPLLPDEIVPHDERDALVAAMRRYDRLGRAAWAGFLRERGVLPVAANDLRMAHATVAFAAAGGNA